MAANTATQDALRASFVGKTLDDVPTPAAVLDLAKAETNCQRMLDAVTRLGLGWRAHIKTHKVGRRTAGLMLIKMVSFMCSLLTVRACLPT